MHEGHRARMLERLARDENLADHELLEVVLYNAIPRKNTNEIAHALLSAFGSLRGVMSADTEDLVQVAGVGRATAAYLRAVASLALRAAEEDRDQPFPCITNAGTFEGFLRERYASLHEEVLEIFCLDSHDRVVSCKRFTEHAVNLASAPVTEIARMLSIRRPAGVIVAHNHPKAAALPSGEDDGFTAKMQLLCSMNNIHFNDHVIVGENGTYSYFLTGKLEQMRKTFNVTNLVSRSPQ